ncbi:MAG: hypothetical protein KDM91_19765 [Verrucomicrobiae bacterium]|nr:hypothetical protein [Verrucomicrobiae bacterium]MCP5541178.1 hypothetical protein [Akkermansiaceae bacterium]MCP5550482.1 hypothetical protein [Akkermansiaceae bacterium]
MSERIRQMIRAQLRRRHHPRAWVRREARNLVRAHIGWLRRLELAESRMAA